MDRVVCHSTSSDMHSYCNDATPSGEESELAHSLFGFVSDCVQRPNNIRSLSWQDTNTFTAKKRIASDLPDCDSSLPKRHKLEHSNSIATSAVSTHHMNLDHKKACIFSNSVVRGTLLKVASPPPIFSSAFLVYHNEKERDYELISSSLSTAESQLETLRRYYDSLTTTISFLSESLYSTEKSNAAIMEYVLTIQRRISPLFTMIEQLWPLDTLPVPADTGIDWKDFRLRLATAKHTLTTEAILHYNSNNS